VTRVRPRVRAIVLTACPSWRNAWIAAKRACCRSSPRLGSGARGGAGSAGGTWSAGSTWSSPGTTGSAGPVSSGGGDWLAARRATPWRATTRSRRSPTCFRRCQRSATWVAVGAPWRIPSASTPLRSRATVVTAGLASSQVATASALRSGKMSTG